MPRKNSKLWFKYKFNEINIRLFKSQIKIIKKC